MFREAERRAKQMMRSPSISREVTANKILSGMNTSNNARRRSRGQQQPHERTRKNSRVPVHPVSGYYISYCDQYCQISAPVQY